MSGFWIPTVIPASFLLPQTVMLSIFSQVHKFLCSVLTSHRYINLCALFSHRYINFNSLQGGIKRHVPFEDKLRQVFLEDILETPFPGRFAVEFGFLLAYAEEIPDEIIAR